MSSPAEPDDPLSSPGVSVRRYSLAAILRELKRDRAHKTFTMEKLDSAQIEEIFRSPPPDHGPDARLS
jgi:hypothetical protein